MSSEDGNSEDDISSESFELMSARSRLAGQWAAQDEAELPATDARGGKTVIFNLELVDALVPVLRSFCERLVTFSSMWVVFC